MPNRLAHQTWPYLLQHADNPVDWYPWGEEALSGPSREQADFSLHRLFGCYWCHVMERESFMDDEVAALMNEHFVSASRSIAKNGRTSTGFT